MKNTIFTENELKENYEVITKLLASVQEDDEHVGKAIDLLERLPMQSVPGDIATQAKANAAMEIVKTRENTNQKLIDAYVKMYDDLRDAVFNTCKEKSAEEIAENFKEETTDGKN